MGNGGELVAKNLRGESMTDVIFNGSSARKPVGQASVELVFDNQDRKLTGEYVNYNEVAVRRKVDRMAILFIRLTELPAGEKI